MKASGRPDTAFVCLFCRTRAYKSSFVHSELPTISRRLLTTAAAEANQFDKSLPPDYDHEAVQRQYGASSTAVQGLLKSSRKSEDTAAGAQKVKRTSRASVGYRVTTRSQQSQKSTQQVNAGNSQPISGKGGTASLSIERDVDLSKLPNIHFLRLFAIIRDKLDAANVRQLYETTQKYSHVSFKGFARDCEQKGLLGWHGPNNLKVAMLHGVLQAWGDRKMDEVFDDLSYLRREMPTHEVHDSKSLDLMLDLVGKYAFQEAAKIIVKHDQRKAVYDSNDHQQGKAGGLRQEQISQGLMENAQILSHFDGLTQQPPHATGAIPETPKSRRKKNQDNMGESEQNKPSTKQLDPSTLTLRSLESNQPPIPTLAHDLQRVLFNPGIYQLQDPRSRVFNFDPYLKSIMPIAEFDFGALSDYVTSSRDNTLIQLAKDRGRRYLGSTSSMTSVLSQFHFLLSAWREITTSMLSRGFPESYTQVSQISRAPAAVILRHKEGVYAIDADKEFDQQTVLSSLGKSMEKLLTSSKEVYERYRRRNEQESSLVEKPPRESYHYSEIGNFLMRAQLDAKDSRLPGTGVFDLKTRAVVSVRMDVLNYQEGLGYQIKDRFGEFESYEREFFDMIRSAFLKYSLQVRIGRMDGIFVAYHNVESIFGFQYISLPELDSTIHGQTDTTLGDQELKLSLGIWNDVLDRATQKFPGRSIRLHFESRESKIQPFMYVFAEPVDEQQIAQMDAEKAHAWEDFLTEARKHETSDTNLEHETVDTSLEHNPTEDSRGSWDAIAGEGDTSEEELIRMAPGNDAKDGVVNESEEAVGSAPRELLALLITVENRVNGEKVVRPSQLTSTDRWTVNYTVLEVDSPRSGLLYERCLRRRKTILGSDGRDNAYATAYVKRLRRLSKAGREWLQGQNEKASTQPPVFLYNKESQP